MPFVAALIFVAASAEAAEMMVKLPEYDAVVTVMDDGGLSCTVAFNGREVVAKSRCGIIADEVGLGANVTLKQASTHTTHRTTLTVGGVRKGLLNMTTM